MTKLNEFLNYFNHNIDPVEYPEYNFSTKKRINKNELIKQFSIFWELAGGKIIKTNQKKKALEEVLKLNIITQKSLVYSTIHLEELKNFPIILLKDKKIKKPHDFKELDILIIEAKLAIADQGAVWISKNTLIYDSALFLCKHQVILINKKNLYYNMEDAYPKWIKLSSDGGYWISGPSKTADIEQSLVIGAHGPLSSIAIIY
ncbi:MAG: hypothetical protein KatS3mg129_1291 [Leptospiraceae bacterium]|nr:MAG: hypothetical protein KatS3mg129_1291 [Leptospiraceae bacterium]